MKVVNIILLDASGSMQAIYESTVSGCNEILQTIASAASDTSLEQWVQLTSFNSCCLTELIPLGKAHEALALLPRQYQPNCTTPLYDAMGVTFSKVEQQLLADTEVKVYCTIITDGLENASHEFDLPLIQSLIARLRQKQWEFVFIGADFDVVAVAGGLGIHKTIRYSRNSESTRKMFVEESLARRNYYAFSREKGKESPTDFHINIAD